MAISPTKNKASTLEPPSTNSLKKLGTKANSYWKMQKDGMKRPILQRNLKKSANEFGELFKNKSRANLWKLEHAPKTAKDKKSMGFAEFKECLSVLQKEKKLEPKELLNKPASE
ncbi:hypothetical protein CEXT_39971 [Caerostris extrusa]|uniref:Uncharacterized protein n=1 Tax=Caerostris extrusa TaxID=172846 RepID=A0AAV4SNU5_CAEEX|nr:hypothetical protein CEXT_39971 [Caerostris extrusa]